MHVIKGLEWTFNTVVSAYEKFRSGFTDELYKMIFDYIVLNESCYVIEVGIGGGQATLPFLKTGCNLTAVEYIITNRFENEPFLDNSYDLVYYRDKGNLPLSEEMDRIYAKYYYKFYNREPEVPTEYSEEQAVRRAKIADKKWSDTADRK